MEGRSERAKTSAGRSVSPAREAESLSAAFASSEGRKWYELAGGGSGASGARADAAAHRAGGRHGQAYEQYGLQGHSLPPLAVGMSALPSESRASLMRGASASMNMQRSHLDDDVASVSSGTLVTHASQPTMTAQQRQHQQLHDPHDSIDLADEFDITQELMYPEPDELSAPEAAISESSTMLHSRVSTERSSLARVKILILMSDTGGGHRASAEALKTAFEQQFGSMCEIVIKDFWVQLAGFPFRNFPQQYATLAKYPWMWKFLYNLTKIRIARGFNDFVFELFAYQNVRDFFEEFRPDLVISVHPLVQQLTKEILLCFEEESKVMHVPFITVVTDYGGAHPTWFHRGVDLCYVPSEPVKAVAFEEGMRSEQVRMFGLPVRPAFWEETRSVAAIRAHLGLDTHAQTVLIVGGGDGVGGLQAVATAVAQRVAASGAGSVANGALPKAPAPAASSTLVQIVVICGKNKLLAAELRKLKVGVPMHVLEFVNNMHEWMRASDLIITKAGPGTIAEALICGLPVLLSSYLPGQEEGNVHFVLENKIGAYSDEPDEIASIVVQWLSDPVELALWRERVKTFGRPLATKEIVQDAWEFCMVKLQDRMKQIANLRVEQQKRRAEHLAHRNELVANRNELLSGGGGGYWGVVRALAGPCGECMGDCGSQYEFDEEGHVRERHPLTYSLLLGRLSEMFQSMWASLSKSDQNHRRYARLRRE
ncbi:Monogalactosyldiacylglycerol synthase, chloroplastic [Porphyridium purpureum]|uniref:monogalactosyldiacylglycerol synthase n=1 Tax=Porphyridium purpureum TaxID=35688 RepID=A0A5J4YXD7_PORPP|nr:Monogalactosyldiacylglycerol synthase, chloroplastic [Porphyridium purpureum]|eukprot:POR2678..scf227_4